MDQDDLENPMLETASKLLLSGTADGADLRTVDPETQARLEALLEAAGTSVSSAYMVIVATMCINKNSCQLYTCNFFFAYDLFI